MDTSASCEARTAPSPYPTNSPCRALAAALPAARLIEIPDAGHLVNFARPVEFNAAITSFLDALPIDPGR
jgi:pimeloyl-ACP methyl ester carboxylesterase